MPLGFPMVGLGVSGGTFKTGSLGFYGGYV